MHDQLIIFLLNLCIIQLHGTVSITHDRFKQCHINIYLYLVHCGQGEKVHVHTCTQNSSHNLHIRAYKVMWIHTLKHIYIHGICLFHRENIQNLHQTKVHEHWNYCSKTVPLHSQRKMLAVSIPQFCVSIQIKLFRMNYICS